jgi:gas vesicle protein
MKNKQRKQGYSGSLVLVATFLGGLVGMAVAYLTPKTGETFRQKIQSYTTDDSLSVVSETTKTVTDLIDNVRDTLTKSLTYGNEVLDNTKKLINNAYEAGKEAYEQKIEPSDKQDDDQVM